MLLGENDNLADFRRGLAGKGVVMWSLGLGLVEAREWHFTGLHSFLAGNVGQENGSGRRQREEKEKEKVDVPPGGRSRSEELHIGRVYSVPNMY